MYLRPLVNRNPAQRQATYVRDRDAFRGWCDHAGDPRGPPNPRRVPVSFQRPTNALAWRISGRSESARSAMTSSFW